MHSGGRRFNPCQLHKFCFLTIWKLERLTHLSGDSMSPSHLQDKQHFGKATKGVRGMPRHMEAMKDVISCDKPRVGANNL